MRYVELTDLSALIPPATLTEALDDNGDGAADAGLFDGLSSQVSRDIDGRLGQRYLTPFVYPYPALVVSAARIFAVEALYTRRNLTGDKNPFTAQADKWRDKLDLIGAGKEPLQPGQERARPSASAITEPAKTTPGAGALAT